MTRGWCLVLALALVAAGCGGSSHRTPAQVFRAWSAALSRGDEEAAAALVGPTARFVRTPTASAEAESAARSTSEFAAARSSSSTWSEN